MKSSVFILMIVLIFSACRPSDKKERNGQALFNGKDLSGWKFYKGKENNSWEVVDGTLHCKPFDGNEKRTNLITDNQYENFELNWEWKISAQGNSGVMYKVTEEFDEPYLSGPEYQLLDDVGYPGKIEEWQKTAANYGMHTAPEAKPKLVGEWNTSKIVADGNHVEHWLNGTKVVEYELGSEEWKKIKSTSKWNEAAGYGAAKKGHIALQDHGGEVWFRDIRITEIR